MDFTPEVQALFITAEGVNMLLQKKRRGEPLPEGWQESVRKYREIRMQLYLKLKYDWNRFEETCLNAVAAADILLEGESHGN